MISIEIITDTTSFNLTLPTFIPMESFYYILAQTELEPAIP